MSTNFNNIEVAIERHEDSGRHVARINGEIVAKLSPHRRPGYGNRVTTWRIVDADNHVHLNGLSALKENAERNIEYLTEAARQLWRRRQPEEIARVAHEHAVTRVQRAESDLERSLRDVRYYRTELAEAKKALAALEAELEAQS